jgi:hypothetical protein
VESWGWAHQSRQWVQQLWWAARGATCVAIMGAARWAALRGGVHHRSPRRRRRGARAPVPGRPRQWSRPRTLRRRGRQEGHERHDQQQPACVHRTRRCSAETHANRHSKRRLAGDVTISRSFWLGLGSPSLACS